MIAYNGTGLDNRVILEQARVAMVANCITGEEGDRIKTAYPDLLYTPNIYVRVGLFVLTFIIVLFSFGLLVLLIGPAGNAIGPLLILGGVICYGSLEYFIYARRHFRSGVDDALRWMAAGLIVAGICISAENIGNAEQYFVVLLLACWCCLRFADRLMAVVGFAALLGVLVNVCMELGNTGRVVAPFLIMAVSLSIYFLCAPLFPKEKYRHYRGCLDFIRAAALVGFYLAGNYFVVRETNGLFSNQPGIQPVGFGPAGIAHEIPMAWLFWVFTLVTPFCYLYIGLRKKDRLFIWVGLALVAGAIFTIRHYYSVLPLEWAMTMGGLVLIGVAYAAIRYLKTPKHGFTGEETDDRHGVGGISIESLVIAESFTPAAHPQPGHDFKFGGGSGGGGGAGGEY